MSEIEEKKKIITKVLDLDGKEVSQMELSEKIFDLEFNIDLLQEVLHWQMAKSRSESGHTKNVSALNGSTRKFRPQKRSGRARMGAKGAVHHRGGAVAFGPNGRSYTFAMSKRKIKGALATALSQKLREESLIVIKNFDFSKISTKLLLEKINKFSPEDNFLLINNENNKNLTLSARNLYRCDVLNIEGINPLSIVKHRKVLISQEAIKTLEEKYKKLEERRSKNA